MDTFCVSLASGPAAKFFDKMAELVNAQNNEVDLLKAEKSKVESLADEAIQKYASATAENIEREKLLFSKFSILLNAKKARICELERQEKRRRNNQSSDDAVGNSSGGSSDNEDESLPKPRLVTPKLAATLAKKTPPARSGTKRYVCVFHIHNSLSPSLIFFIRIHFRPADNLPPTGDLDLEDLS